MDKNDFFRQKVEMMAKELAETKERARIEAAMAQEEIARAKKHAEREKKRAKEEKARAEEEKARAEEEKARAEDLAAKLLDAVIPEQQANFIEKKPKGEEQHLNFVNFESRKPNQV